MGQLKNWIDVSVQLVNQCFGRSDDAAILWLRDVVYTPHTFLGIKNANPMLKAFGNAVGTGMLMMVINAATVENPSRQVSELHDRLINDTHKAIQSGWPLKGQQMFWLAVQSFKTNDDLGHV